jgi:hypothetical protein
VPEVLPVRDRRERKFLSTVWEERKVRASAIRSNPALLAVRIVDWVLSLGGMYQQSPDKDEIIVPFVDKQTVFFLFDRDCKELGQASCAASYFFAVWRDDHRAAKVKIRSFQRFAKCDTCVNMRERQVKCLDPVERAALLEEVHAHHMYVKAERLSYYARRELAKMHPTLYLSLIIDGADQSKHELPHFKEADHNTQSLWAIHVYLMGVLSHGRQPMGVTYLPNVKQGSNVTIDVLHTYLMHLLAVEHTLPPTLLLQLDNTCKQCKSKYLFG